MTVVVEGAVAMAVGLSAAAEECGSVSLSDLGEDELLTMVRELERARRRLEALDHRLIAEVRERNLPGRYVMRSTAALLSGLLNLSPREAAARVRHADHLGPRVTVTSVARPRPSPPDATSGHDQRLSDSPGRRVRRRRAIA